MGLLTLCIQSHARVGRARGALWFLMGGQTLVILLFWSFLQLSLASLPSLLLAGALAMIVPAVLLLVHGTIVGMVSEPTPVSSVRDAARVALGTTPRLAEAVAYGIAVGLLLERVPPLLARLAKLSLPRGVDPWLFSSLRDLALGGFSGPWRYLLWAGLLPAVIIGLTLEAKEGREAVWRVVWEGPRHLVCICARATGVFLGCSVIFLGIPQVLLQWEGPFIWQAWVEILLLGIRVGAAFLFACYGWMLALAMATIQLTSAGGRGSAISVACMEERGDTHGAEAPAPPDGPLRLSVW